MNRAVELRIDLTIIAHPNCDEQELEATVDYICQVLESQSNLPTSGAGFQVEDDFF